MSVAYIPVQWNRNKWLYNAVLLGMVVLYLVLFLKVAPAFPVASPAPAPDPYPARLPIHPRNARSAEVRRGRPVAPG